MGLLQEFGNGATELNFIVALFRRDRQGKQVLIPLWVILLPAAYLTRGIACFDTL